MLSPPNFMLAVTFPSNSFPYKQHLNLGLIPVGAPRSLPVHPVQLYEALGALLLFFVLQRAFESRKRPGQIFCFFGLSYGLCRFGLEFLRAANPLSYWGMSISQVISILLALGCATVLVIRRLFLNSSLPALEISPANTATEESLKT